MEKIFSAGVALYISGNRASVTLFIHWKCMGIRFINRKCSCHLYGPVRSCQTIFFTETINYNFNLINV